MQNLMENIVAVVYTTVNNTKNARKIARALVEEKLVACVNIIPKIESIYRWKGKLQKHGEYIAIIKCADKNARKLTNHLSELHPYSVPAIMWHNEATTPKYSKWINETAKR